MRRHIFLSAGETSGDVIGASLMRALRDMNMPKFIYADVPLFRGLIGDLFPGLDCPRVRYPSFNDAVEQVGANVAAQFLQTEGDLGYAVADLEGDLPADFLDRVRAIDGTIRARLIKG